MRSKVLIVDDMELNREMLTTILEDEYPILEADGGRKAIEMIRENKDDIAVVLLDLIMPEVDGFAVLETMKNQSWLKTIPVLVITAESRAEVENRCFEMGVADFIKKPFDNAIVKNRVKNIVDLFGYRNQLEEKVEKQTRAIKKQYKLLMIQAEKLKESNTNIIDILGTVVEYRNLESREHIKRIKGFTKILAEQMMNDYPEYGLTQEKIDIIVSASALHDIGKIAIPDSILLKPGKLSKDEDEYMKSHTTRGCEVLNNIKDVWDEAYSKVSYEICRYHHERYDGKGYPDRLAGEAIPVPAQLVGLADVYDDLISELMYKSAYSDEEAFHMVVSGECGVFSPKLLECFRRARKKLEALNQAQKKNSEEAE